MATLLPLDSIDLHLWSTGTKRERGIEADKLIEQVKYCGSGAVTDNGQMLSRQFVVDAYSAISLLLRNKISEEVRRKNIVHPTDTNLGYSWPGRESYKKDEPEKWKRFIRIGRRNDSFDEINKCWLSKEVLETHFTSEEASFLDHFQRKGIYDFFDQFFALSTIPLNILGEHYYGLPRNYFSGTRTVVGKDYKLVKDNTLQLLQYIVGVNPFDGVTSAKLGDSFAGMHKDSSTGTLGDISRDPYHCLEVLANDGNKEPAAEDAPWISPILREDSYFFQFGKTFTALAVALHDEGKIDLGKLKYGPFTATDHRVVRKNLDHERPMVAGFNHPDLDMVIGNSTARGVLFGDLDGYMKMV